MKEAQPPHAIKPFSSRTQLYLHILTAEGQNDCVSNIFSNIVMAPYITIDNNSAKQFILIIIKYD